MKRLQHNPTCRVLFLLVKANRTLICSLLPLPSHDMIGKDPDMGDRGGIRWIDPTEHLKRG
jgi:hypothetical protein